MSIFKRKKEVGQSNVLTNKTVPAYLPVHGELWTHSSHPIIRTRTQKSLVNVIRMR